MADKALLVIELQNDYLWEKRKTKFTFDTEALISAVNAEIAARQAAGYDIIYIAQIFPDTPSNHLIFGFCIEQTEGAKLYSGLDVVSDLYFEKNVADAFLSEDFAAFVRERGYQELLLCGTDLCGSIAATAKGAVSAGIHAAVVTKCTGSRFPANQTAVTRADLKASGVELI